MFMRAALPLVCVAGSTLLACAEPAPEPGPETTTSTATAIVAVERTVGPGDAVRGDAVLARFVRVRQGTVDDAALRIAGVATDLPNPGSCFVPADNAPVVQRSVELLDVGQVVVSQPFEGARSIILAPRAMPDPTGVVSGVFYSTRATDAFASGGRLSLRSSGGADLEGFSVSVSAPRDLADVHVSSLSTGLDIVWDGADTDAHDLVYVDVLAPGPHVALRCTSVDAGHLLIPQGSIPGIEEGQLAIHRVHKESFRAKGIEPGEVRFDVAKITPFRR